MLVLLVGSELIRNSVDRWFNAPMDEMLTSANAIAGDYYQEQQRLVSEQAQRLARDLATTDLTADPVSVQDRVTPDVLQERLELVEVYRVGSGHGPAGRPGGRRGRARRCRGSIRAPPPTGWPSVRWPAAPTCR